MKTEFKKYMDEPRIVTGASGEKTIKNRDIFFYPWEDRSPDLIRKFVAEQRRIAEKVSAPCRYCGDVGTKKLEYFDDRNKRRHVQATCTECWNILGYVSDVPNPGNKMPAGKYRGKTMSMIYREDPRYLAWFMSNSIEGDPDKDKVIQAIEATMDGANTDRRTYVIPPESFLKKLEEEAL